MSLLDIEHVSKEFVGHKALDDVCLSAETGKIHGLLGPNGAGKTTLIRIINHITAPDSGKVTFDGHPLRFEDVDSMGYLPEERGLYKKMKVAEQAILFARLKGMTKRDASAALDEWLNRFGIESWRDKRIEELSKGMAQKVQFIITVMHRPKLVILDEPFSGFDPINANLLKGEVERLRDGGTTIILSTHNMESVESLCDNITLLNKSRVILSGEVSEIRRINGSNRYKFVYQGAHSDLVGSFGDLVVESDSSENAQGTSVSTIRFVDGVDVKRIIGMANEAVTLDSFSADMPSMNEIFIKTVQHNNL